MNAEFDLLLAGVGHARLGTVPVAEQAMTEEQALVGTGITCSCASKRVAWQTLTRRKNLTQLKEKTL